LTVKQYQKLVQLVEKAQLCESREKAQKILLKVEKTERKIRKKMTAESELESKGYAYDPDNKWWSREWTTNAGSERIQEVAAFTGKTWRKLMIGSDGKTFYEDPVEDKLTAQYGAISERPTSIEHHGG
jgi:hypothetical protein